MKARLFALLLLALPVVAFPQYKPLYNYYNFAYGAKALAMGNAFVAVADDLTATFWNPAGLAALRSPELYLSYKTSSQTHDYDLQSRVLPVETWLYNYDFKSRLNQIDFFSVSAPARLLKRPCTFALSYYRYIPYGFKGSATEVLSFLKDPLHPRIITDTFTGSEGLDVLAFSAAAALTDYFSLGVTLQQFFGSGSLHQVMENPQGESHSQITEKMQGRNVVVGLIFSPFRAFRLGFTWHEGLKSDLDSDLLTWDVNSKGKEVDQREDSCLARLELPQQLALGALLSPARWLDLSAEYSVLDWQDATITDYYVAGEVLPYPQKDAWPQAQKRARNMRFGLEARLPLSAWLLHLRGGWSGTRQLYADVTDRAVRITGIAAGLGCDMSEYLTLEVAFQRQRSDWPEQGFVSKNPPVDTHFRASIFFLTLTYRFGHIFKD
jgi:hypothetical protein